MRKQHKIGSMPVRIVQSKDNARLKELRRAWARPSATGRAALEGPHLLGEALRGGLRMPYVFVAQGAEGLLEGLHLPPGTEVLILPEKLLAAALTTETPQPVAALVEPPDWTWADILQEQVGTPLLIVLAGLQDPGNLGTIVRSAEAFGASGIVALPGTVSAWNPKSVRASAGSIFRVPLIAAGEQDCLDRLREARVNIYAATARHGQPAGGIDLAGPAALLIGNEGKGVPDALAAKADGAVTIPCPGPVESLNAAVAASVLLYEAARQRSSHAATRPAKRRAR